MISSERYFRKNDFSLRLKGDENIFPTKEDYILRYGKNNGLMSSKDFILYTMDLSYFSGKLEMYLRYKEINHHRFEPHALEFETILCKNTGTEQLPQLYDNRLMTKENKRWLRDTTYIIDHLEHDQLISQKSLPVLTNCELQTFFMKLFEDYADEHLWRPAMFWRWEPSFDRTVMGLRFTYEFARTSQSRYWLIPPFLRPYLLSLRQWLLSSYGEDCNTQEKKQVVINQYYELLKVMESILITSPYLFGNRPTLIDFAFSGPFFRHFSSDFTPRKVMQNFAPNTYEWVARLWNCTSTKMKFIEPNFPESGTLPDSWDPLLKLLADYFEYSQLNYDAQISNISASLRNPEFEELHNNKLFFEWKNKGQVFKVPVVHYRAWCKQELVKEFHKCSKATQNKIIEILKSKTSSDFDFDTFFEITGMENIEIEPECGTHPPFALSADTTGSQLSYKWDANSIFFPYFFKRGVMFLGFFLASYIGLKFSNNKQLFYYVKYVM